MIATPGADTNRNVRGGPPRLACGTAYAVVAVAGDVRCNRVRLATARR